MTTYTQALIDAAQAVIDSADNSGCTDDLTVVEQSALDKLAEAIEGARSVKPLRPARVHTD